MSYTIFGGMGYIGSALTTHLLNKGWDVQSIDECRRGEPLPEINRRQSLQAALADGWTASGPVVLLAGASTVAECDADPAKAFEDNVIAFASLSERLNGWPLLYASSVSVYGQTSYGAEDSFLPPPLKLYDFHKQTIDRFAAISGKRMYGLRFGTVCGPSPNIRPTALNTMVKSALETGIAPCANPNTKRPILGINDLCRAVAGLLAWSRDVPPGAYNLASFNMTFGGLAQAVADMTGATVKPVEIATAYDVAVTNSKFRKAFGFEFKDTPESIIDSLIKEGLKSD